MPYYRYMIGGTVQTESVYCLDVRDALRRIKRMDQFRELGDDLTPKRENLMIYDGNNGNWRPV